MRRAPAVLSVLAAVLGLTLACSSSSDGRTTTTPPTASHAVDATSASSALPHFAHVVVVVMENHGYSQVVGSRNAPFVNGLIRSGVLLTRSYGVTHPSEPNYLALFSGSTHGLASDTCPLTYRGANLATVLAARHLHFAGYSEGLPRQGSTACSSGSYARKHNPWSDFTTVPATANRTFAQFPTDFTTLPQVAFVVPDLEHDMHDGTVRQGDAWLAAHLGGYARWARTHDSLLVVTYDEDERAEGNRIPTVLAGAHLRAGARTGQHVDHFGLLRTIEDVFDTAHLGSSATRRPISGIWS
ncbi:MAG: alkaline phosphatase family protein [Jatrophihabitans sp.]|uniref:alkaline phosphatase family protein n=1 Tax=Jatrophihabitans sp. TaxID=1932789 RepID=UPI003F7FB77C